MSATLFKYFPSSAIGLFAKRGFSLTPPIYLNDDFEFAGPVKPPDETERHALFDRFVHDEYENALGGNRLLRLDQFCEKREEFRAGYVAMLSNQKYVLRLSPNLQRDLSAYFGISCFTEVPDSQLMWERYGDSFRGFVAEFATDGEAIVEGTAVRWSKMGPCSKVAYQTDLPCINWRGTNMLECCRIKGIKWADEREWRIVLPLGAGKQIEGTQRRYIPFPAESLRRIICGNRMSDTDKETIRIMLSEHSLAHVSLESVFPNPQTQEIKFGPPLD